MTTEQEIAFTAKVEIRTWYENGKYEGRNATWKAFVPGVVNPLAYEIAEKSIATFVERELGNRKEALLFRTAESDDWDYYANREHCCGPVGIQDWGEFRIKTRPQH